MIGGDAAQVPFDARARVAFDGDAWRTLGPIDSSDLRLGMARDLLASGALDGLTRAEVLARLGEPTYRDARSGELGYELNEEHRGGNIDPSATEYLVVRFGDDGRVSRAEHVEWRDGE
ncbi:MAG TPA: hypothetical protein VFF06_19785 [Polyangia bacterium]|nr:hypothetical protein [Polyangia bacterium]